MVRIKRGKTALKRRRKVLKETKGYKWGRKSKERAAKEALLHAYLHSFQDRRKKKNVARRLWQIKINAAAREQDLSYSRFTNQMKLAGVLIDRKILAQLIEKEPAIFKKIVEEIKKS